MSFYIISFVSMLFCFCKAVWEKTAENVILYFIHESIKSNLIVFSYWSCLGILGLLVPKKNEYRDTIVSFINTFQCSSCRVSLLRLSAEEEPLLPEGFPAGALSAWRFGSPQWKLADVDVFFCNLFLAELNNRKKMDDQGCPRCKTTKYRNPSLKLMVNVCGHTLWVLQRPRRAAAAPLL